MVGTTATTNMEIDNANANNKTNQEGEWKAVAANKQRIPGLILANHCVWFNHNGTKFQTTTIEIQTNHSDFKQMQKLMSRYNDQDGTIGKFVSFGLDKKGRPRRCHT